MKIRKTLLSLALSGTMALGLLPGMAAYADSSYTLTIPSTLNVANAGWNATDGVSAAGTLDSGKKLTVTASSANSWALKSGDNSVGYTLTTAEDGSQTTSWEFTELSSTAATQPMGIIVEDYSNKPAGTYTDTVTFTAGVESAIKTYTTLAVGDVIHLGDILQNTTETEYYLFGQSLESYFGPYTLVRANIDDSDWPPAKEAENGQYYVFKSNDGSYYAYCLGHDGVFLEVTPSSDGIKVSSLDGINVRFAVHEP